MISIKFLINFPECRILILIDLHIDYGDRVKIVSVLVAKCLCDLVFLLSMDCMRQFHKTLIELYCRLYFVFVLIFGRTIVVVLVAIVPIYTLMNVFIWNILFFIAHSVRLDKDHTQAHFK